MRKPMVTRSFKVTVANVLVLNVETAEPSNKEVTVSGTFKDDSKLMKAIESVVTMPEKAVHIVDKHEDEVLYGMSEQDFLKYAVVLDKETRKPVATETTESEQ